MPKYIVEREIPGAGNILTEEMWAISQKSCAVTSQMGPQIQRIESYVTDDKVYCVILLQMKKWYDNTPDGEDFRSIIFRWLDR